MEKQIYKKDDLVYFIDNYRRVSFGLIDDYDKENNYYYISTLTFVLSYLQEVKNNKKLKQMIGKRIGYNDTFTEEDFNRIIRYTYEEISKIKFYPNKRRDVLNLVRNEILIRERECIYLAKEGVERVGFGGIFYNGEEYVRKEYKIVFRIKPKDIFMTYEETQEELNKRKAEIERINNLSDYEYSVEEINKTLDKFCSKRRKVYSNIIFKMNNLENIETRVFCNRLQYRYGFYQDWQYLLKEEENFDMNAYIVCKGNLKRKKKPTEIQQIISDNWNYSNILYLYGIPNYPFDVHIKEDSKEILYQIDVQLRTDEQLYHIYFHGLDNGFLILKNTKYNTVKKYICGNSDVYNDFYGFARKTQSVFTIDEILSLFVNKDWKKYKIQNNEANIMLLDKIKDLFIQELLKNNLIKYNKKLKKYIDSSL